MKKTKLFSDSHRFKKQTKKDWHKILKKRDLTINYKSKVFDPIYFQEEITQTNSFYNNSDWQITSEININSEIKANKEALKLLKMGVNSITFLNFKNHNLETILKDIQIDIIKLNFSSIILSFIFSYLTMVAFLGYIKKASLDVFVLYRVVLGVIILIFAYQG